MSSASQPARSGSSPDADRGDLRAPQPAASGSSPDADSGCLRQPRWRAAASWAALASANARYWSTVFPLARAQLAYLEKIAAEIAQPERRTLAMRKLRDERFNVQLAATFATLAPRPHRRLALEANVALQALYDYLDALGERFPGDDRARQQTLVHAVSLHTECASTDDLYCRELASTVKWALARLPAGEVVLQPARAAAQRCAHAQALYHAAADGCSEELERWARGQAQGTTLGWPEWLAGAQASVLCLHALICAASDPRTTPCEAQRLDSLYLSIGALTMLDSLVDLDEDAAAGQLGYLRFYEAPEQMGASLAHAARGALVQARALRHTAHHAMTLAGVVAHYAAAAEPPSPAASAAIEPVRFELGWMLAPTLALMRSWRAAKRLRLRAPRARHPGRSCARERA